MHGTFIKIIEAQQAKICNLLIEIVLPTAAIDLLM